MQIKNNVNKSVNNNLTKYKLTNKIKNIPKVEY